MNFSRTILYKKIYFFFKFLKTKKLTFLLFLILNNFLATKEMQKLNKLQKKSQNKNYNFYFGILNYLNLKNKNSRYYNLKNKFDKKFVTTYNNIFFFCDSLTQHNNKPKIIKLLQKTKLQSLNINNKIFIKSKILNFLKIFKKFNAKITHLNLTFKQKNFFCLLQDKKKIFLKASLGIKKQIKRSRRLKLFNCINLIKTFLFITNKIFKKIKTKILAITIKKKKKINYIKLLNFINNHHIFNKNNKTNQTIKINTIKLNTKKSFGQTKIKRLKRKRKKRKSKKFIKKFIKKNNNFFMNSKKYFPTVNKN